MFLALREIRRSKGRFGLLAGAVSLLAFLILFQYALLVGLVTQFIGAIRNQSAPVLVYGTQARRNVEGSQVSAAQAAAIAALDGVLQTGPIGEGTFTVTARGRLVDAVLFGYRLDGPGRPTSLIEGRLPTGRDEAVASAKDRKNGFGIGDQVRVEPGGATITVVGLARDLNYSVAPTLFVSFDTYAAARKVRNPDAVSVEASVVGVVPVAGVGEGDLAARITAQVPGVEALTRGQAVDGSPGVAQVRSSFDLVLALNIAVVPLVIGLFFLILTFQKTAALTLLHAIGAPSRQLSATLLVQATIVIVVGMGLGSLGLAAAAAALGESSVPIRFSPTAAVVVGVIVLAVSYLAAGAAVRRISRIEPVRATMPPGVMQ